MKSLEITICRAIKNDVQFKPDIILTVINALKNKSSNFIALCYHQILKVFQEIIYKFDSFKNEITQKVNQV